MVVVFVFVVVVVLQERDFKEIVHERSSYLLRAVNACVHLQALLLKKRPLDARRKQRGMAGGGAATTAEERSLGRFARKDFYRCILDNALVPNSSTLEVSGVYRLLVGPLRKGHPLSTKDTLLDPFPTAVDHFLAL